MVYSTGFSICYYIVYKRESRIIKFGVCFLTPCGARIGLSCGYNTFHDGSTRAALPDTPNDSAKKLIPLSRRTQCHGQKKRKKERPVSLLLCNKLKSINKETVLYQLI